MRKNTDLIIITIYSITVILLAVFFISWNAPDLSGMWQLSTDSERYLEFKENGDIHFINNDEVTPAHYKIKSDSTLNISCGSGPVFSTSSEFTYSLNGEDLTINGLSYKRIN